jgi:outer membrane protein assembly factor BamA
MPRRLTSGVLTSVNFAGLVIAVLLVIAALLAPAAAHARAGETGQISRIVFSGNEHTREIVLRRVMNLAEGDTLDDDRLDASWDALEDCGWFRYVDMSVESDDNGGVVLSVTVEEDLTTFYGPLARYSRRHKYLLGGWLEQRNLGGRGQKLRLEVSALYLQSAGLEWTLPWLAGVDGLTGTVSARGEQAEFVFRPTRYRTWDAEMSARWVFVGPVFVQAGVRGGHFTQRDAYTWATPDRGGEAPASLQTYDAGGEDHWRLAAGIGFDTRDNPYYPSRGGSLLLESARWNSNGFDDYDEYTADARAFVPLPAGKHLLALHGWGRRVDGPTSLDNQLFLGGPETIRGARFGSLEGDEGWLLSAEYRLPLVMVPIAPGGESVGLGLHAFADGGQAWYEGARPGDPVFTWGGGAHVNLDTWQLRFEAARDEAGDWYFEFADRFSF